MAVLRHVLEVAGEVWRHGREPVSRDDGQPSGVHPYARPSVYECGGGGALGLEKGRHIRFGQVDMKVVVEPSVHVSRQLHA